MNTVLVLLANVLAVAAFPALSPTFLEIAAYVAAAALLGITLFDYSRPRRSLPGLQSASRRKTVAVRPAAARTLTAV